MVKSIESISSKEINSHNISILTWISISETSRSLYLWTSTKYWTWPSFSFLAVLKVITTWGQMLCVWIDTKIQRANKVVRVTYNYSKKKKITIVFTKFSLQIKTIVHCRKLFGIWLSFSSSCTLEQNREYRIVM